MRSPDASPRPVLRIRDLVAEFGTPAGPLRAANGVSYELFPGETLGVVGETGSGESVTERRRRLGREIAMVFQDPISALNPVRRVGDQIAEALRVHDPALSTRAARARVLELLGLVGVPSLFALDSGSTGLTTDPRDFVILTETKVA